MRERTGKRKVEKIVVSHASKRCLYAIYNDRCQCNFTETTEFPFPFKITLAEHVHQLFESEKKQKGFYGLINL